MAWSPDGERLASGSWDNTVRVWSAADGRELAKLNGHSNTVTSVAWSPDGERLASGSWDNTVRVWSAADGRELAKLNGHSNTVTSVAWSPDGERLASGSYDKTVRVWSAADGRELAVFECVAGSSLVRASNGHFFIHRIGAVSPMLGIPAGDRNSVAYVPLAGLRNHQQPQAIAATMRGEIAPSPPEAAGWSPCRPWDGQVVTLTIRATNPTDHTDVGQGPSWTRGWGLSK